MIKFLIYMRKSYITGKTRILIHVNHDRLLTIRHSSLYFYSVRFEIAIQFALTYLKLSSDLELRSECNFITKGLKLIA